MRNFKRITILLFVIVPALNSFKIDAQEQVSAIPDSLITAAREIIKSTGYCALVTVNGSGQPNVRTMNPFPLGEDMTIWFATSRISRKASEIKNDERVCVYFADHSNAKGYVTIIGTATVIDDKKLLLKKKREYWESIPGWQDKFVLIKIEPKSMEVVNYSHKLYGDPETFRAPSMEF